MTTRKNITEITKVNYLQPAFLICVCLLATTAGVMSATIKMAGIYLKKEPLPLKKTLSDLDKSNLGPYKVVAKSKIENQDVLNTLGTEDYIQWTLEDTNEPEGSATRFCTLFITYYATPDKVPHVPEECYIGGGFERVSSDEVAIKIDSTPSGAAGQQQVSARYLVFGRTNPDPLVGKATFSVLYIFSVNGQYAGSREDTRLILNKNLFGKFSYFSKVEWKFYNGNFGRLIYPNRPQTISASEKLLKVILPVLEKEHWPSGVW
jgi:hypothetical protein